MLVNATEMLLKARDGHYGVPQFNINNLEWTKAVLTACEEMKSPVILGVSEGAGKYMTGFKTVAAMVSAMVDSMGITVPVALHLDHGTYEGCKACVEAGFSSIMFDGSHYSIEENVEKTKELVALAHAHGMSIEAEVGSIGGVEDGVVGAGEIADPVSYTHLPCSSPFFVRRFKCPPLTLWASTSWPVSYTHLAPCGLIHQHRGNGKLPDAARVGQQHCNEHRDCLLYTSYWTRWVPVPPICARTPPSACCGRCSSR